MDGGNIRALREALGLTQEQLAQAIGVSFTTVSRWERAHVKPSPLAMKKLTEMRKEWESELSPEDIVPKKRELTFRGKSSEATSFAHAHVDLDLDRWIEKCRPGCILDEAVIKPYGKGRFQITKIKVKPKGS